MLILVRKIDKNIQRKNKHWIFSEMVFESKIGKKRVLDVNNVIQNPMHKRQKKGIDRSLWMKRHLDC